MPDAQPHVIESLAKLVELWRDLPEVVALERELISQLATTEQPFVGSPLSDALVAGVLPPGIESAWIFVLRPGVRTPPHHHPNSVQHMAVIGGGGSYVVGQLEGVLTTFDPASPSKSILVVPASTPHSFEPGIEPLVVLSFHTVVADQLVEVDGGRTRRYVQP